MKCSMIVSILILLVHAKPRPRRLSNKFVVQQFDCKIDETLCQNLFCNFTVLEDFSTNLTVSYEFKKTISRITVCVYTWNLFVRHFKMAQFQVIMKNYIRTGLVYKEYKEWPSIDFCLLAKGMSMPFVDYGLPNFRKHLGTTLHECPYSVNI
jgi:hypothetical protein